MEEETFLSLDLPAYVSGSPPSMAQKRIRFPGRPATQRRARVSGVPMPEPESIAICTSLLQNLERFRTLFGDTDSEVSSVGTGDRREVRRDSGALGWCRVRSSCEGRRTPSRGKSVGGVGA